MYEVEVFKLYLLVLTRVSGLFVSAPILGSPNFPLTAKAGLAGLLAMILTPTLPALAEPLPDAPVAMLALAAGEFGIGIFLGFLMTLVFAAVQVGGQIMDLQTGFGFMNVFNPALETQFPIFGFFLFILAVLYMLVLNLHHVMIWALVQTYAHVPVGGFTLRPELMYTVTGWGTQLFVDGLMIAAPVAAAMMLAYITLGLLGRVVPQIHLFVIGFPITIAAGLLLTALIIELYLGVLDGMFRRSFEHADAWMRAAG